jgi:hypothetical protein
MVAMTSGSVARLGSVAVVAIAVAIAMVDLGGDKGKAAVAACNADAKTVEIAVAAFRVDNPSLPTTPASLMSPSHGGPFLTSWPKNGSHYSMSVTSAGAVMVSAPSMATARAYDTANPCRSAT